MTNFSDPRIAASAEGDSVCCSFCKKEPATVGDLIAGPALPGDTPAYICQECVELCSSIFQHRKMFGSEEQYAARQRLLEQKIDQHLSILTSLEDDIIRLRWGLTDGDIYSLEEVGEKMGIPPERVGEIEARAIARLRLTEPQA